ncbi:MAG TPA: polysaccharide biosynthesis/export family protein [Gemmatimonadales bacterium]|nr:polysaccharide biosynthesis/export family protein [Gemmatimonadales bacterium]
MGRSKDSARPVVILLRLAILFSVLAIGTPGALLGQAALDDRDARRTSATRAELVAMQERLANATTPDTAATALLYRRLSNGDFQPGDGVSLMVENEQVFTDTFVVSSVREIDLPMVGPVSLRGVLYSEIESYLTQQLSRVLRNPIVHARGLVRIAVTGGVPRPGYYLVPGDAPVSATFQVAGGFLANAKLKDARALRGGETVLDESAMRAALGAGRTLDQLSLGSGDEVTVPIKSGPSVYEVIRGVSLLLTIPLTIYAITQIGH